MKYKNQEGVTIVQLMVTIVLIVIIASFAIWYSSSTSKEAKLARIYAEISSVKEAYEQAINLNEIDSEKYPIYKYEVPAGKTSILTPIRASELSLIYAVEEIQFKEDDGIADDDVLFLITPDNAENIELEKIIFDYVIDATKNKIYIVGGFQRGEKVAYEYNDVARLYSSAFGSSGISVPTP